MAELVGILARARLPASRSNQVVIDGALAFAVTDQQSDRLEFHREVVSWCRSAPFLPAPFGQKLTSGLQEDLSKRAEMLVERLDEVDGRVELVVFFRPNRPMPVHGTGGREYLRSQAKAHEEQDAAKRELSALAGAVTPRWMLSERYDGLRIALLVEKAEARCRLALIASTTQDLARTHTVHTSGPWPPYSFAHAWMEGRT